METFQTKKESVEGENWKGGEGRGKPNSLKSLEIRG